MNIIRLNCSALSKHIYLGMSIQLKQCSILIFEEPYGVSANAQQTSWITTHNKLNLDANSLLAIFFFFFFFFFFFGSYYLLTFCTCGTFHMTFMYTESKCPTITILNKISLSCNKPWLLPYPSSGTAAGAYSIQSR